MTYRTPFIKNVLPWLAEQLNSGKACTLVTLIGVDGSSPRPVGSQLAVRADGAFVGQISAGCAEAAIIAEAVNCLNRGENKCVRYGKDSPYLDVVLPCGSSIDVHFLPLAENAEINLLLKELEERRSAWVSLPLQASEGALQVIEKPDTQDAAALKRGCIVREDAVSLRYDPPIRLLLFGRGTIVGSVTSLASMLEMDVTVYAPDKELLDEAQALGADACHHLVSPDGKFPLPTDKRTAAVLLFHDHEWEPPILQRLLKTKCFYIGAMGSQRTHRIRLDLLEAIGVSPQECARILGPVGLDITAGTPPEIALSIVAQIVQFAAGLEETHTVETAKQREDLVTSAVI